MTPRCIRRGNECDRHSKVGMLTEGGEEDGGMGGGWGRGLMLAAFPQDTCGAHP